MKMLAPRKKLWSTPNDVIDQVLNNLLITSSGLRRVDCQDVLLSFVDVVYDIGAGDGRFLVRYFDIINFTTELCVVALCQPIYCKMYRC